ncbi:hypothetical protein [Streptomyces agglomeratus]|uniref:hypothetical protein n=1 Tax=Streptomyces agglomeratus TaxID=285458 RepID=UPI00114CA146|nr:hypothetical protein [Streptomyces agglomeratus]
MADLTATGPGEDGSVRLLDAHISGDLSLRGATLTNEAGAALVADGLEVGSSAVLAGLTATGHGEKGTVRLPGAHITGQLLLVDDAKLTNEAGPALVADGLQVDSDTSLAGLTATGHGEKGTVRLLGAHITGDLDLRRATLTNEAGPALYADGLQVDSATSLAGLTLPGTARKARCGCRARTSPASFSS